MLSQENLKFNIYLNTYTSLTQITKQTQVYLSRTVLFSLLFLALFLYNLMAQAPSMAGGGGSYRYMKFINLCEYRGFRLSKIKHLIHFGFEGFQVVNGMSRYDPIPLPCHRVRSQVKNYSSIRQATTFVHFT